MKASNDSSDRFEEQAKALFDQSVEQLDARTRSRLTRARNRALDELREGAARRRWMRGPLGGLIAASLVAVAVVLWPGASRTPTDATVAAADDIEIVTGVESLEMLEDVEFYAWLDQR